MLLCIGVVTAMVGNAQKEISPEMQEFYCSGRLQFIGGPNLSTQSSAYEYGGENNTEGKIGVSAGVGLYTEIGQKGMFLPSLQYQSKGSQYTYEGYDDGFDGGFDGGATEDFTTTTSLNYLSAPLQFGFAPSEGRKVFFTGGVTPAYLLSANLKSEGPTGDEESPLDENYSNFDIALNGGVGIRVSDQVLVRANYDHGLSNTSSLEGFEERNRSLNIQLNYNFGFNPFFKESYGGGTRKQ